MTLMLIRIFGINQYIIEIYDTENVKKIVKYFVHQILKNCGRICKSEWHNPVLKMSETTTEGCFPFVTIFNTNQIVRTSQVNF